MFIKIFYFTILTSLCVDAKTVEIENGRISGAEYEKHFAYRGVKYATAERFSLPKPNNEKWTDVKEHKTYGGFCAQYDHFTYDFLGTEDCLFLNIFVPKAVIESNEPAPVIFYIHGGAFVFGGAAYYFEHHIMDHGKMVLVTINYRLGILGFMSTEDEVLPGNLGLKDQLEALKWIQRNIKAFNGDASKVTMVGYSAGGASVQLHYLNPQSDGLFKNGISHSGVALNPWVFSEKSRDKAHQVAEYMNCPHDDHKEMLKCLKHKPVKELVKSIKIFQPFLFNPFSPFGVVVEPVHESAFISENPRVLLQKGKFNRRPWLLTQTKDEGLYPGAELYSKEEYLKKVDENWEEIAQYILHFNDETGDKSKVIKASKMIRELYLCDKEISKTTFSALIDIITDRLFKFNAFEAIQLQSKYSPSFFYHFLYKSLSGLSEYMGNTTDCLGISHGEDVLLIFTHDLREAEYSEEEKEMSQNLINMYFEFSSSNLPKFKQQTISKSTPDAIQALQISSNTQYSMKMLNEKFGNVKFWKKIEDLLHSNERISDEL